MSFGLADSYLQRNLQRDCHQLRLNERLAFSCYDRCSIIVRYFGKFFIFNGQCRAKSTSRQQLHQQPDDSCF